MPCQLSSSWLGLKTACVALLSPGFGLALPVYEGQCLTSYCDSLCCPPLTRLWTGTLSVCGKFLRFSLELIASMRLSLNVFLCLEWECSWSTDISIDWCIDWLIDMLIDWLMKCLLSLTNLLVRGRWVLWSICGKWVSGAFLWPLIVLFLFQAKQLLHAFPLDTKMTDGCKWRCVWCLCVCVCPCVFVCERHLVSCHLLTFQRCHFWLVSNLVSYGISSVLFSFQLSSGSLRSVLRIPLSLILPIRCELLLLLLFSNLFMLIVTIFWIQDFPKSCFKSFLNHPLNSFIIVLWIIF